MSKKMQKILVVLSQALISSIALFSLGIAYAGGVRGVGLLGVWYFMTFGIVVVLAQLIPAGILLSSFVGVAVSPSRGAVTSPGDVRSRESDFRSRKRRKISMNRKTILIAFQDDQWISPLSTLFHSLGYRVETARVVSEMIRKIRKGDSQVVLLDDEITPIFKIGMTESRSCMG